MRNTLQKTYSVTLRMIGLYGLAHFPIVLIFIENFAQERTSHTFPVALLSVFVLTCALFLTRQSWLPAFVARPRHPLSLIAILPGGLILWFMFFMATTFCILMAEMGEPVQRNLSILSALISLAMISLAGLLGTILAVWSTPDTPDEPPKTASTDPFARLQTT